MMQDAVMTPIKNSARKSGISEQNARLVIALLDDMESVIYTEQKPIVGHQVAKSVLIVEDIVLPMVAVDDVKFLHVQKVLKAKANAIFMVEGVDVWL